MAAQVMPAALLTTAALSLWVCSRVVARPVAGGRAFAWLVAAVALWCGTSAGHALAATDSARIGWAKVQYLAIASVAPLWLLFALDYARVPLLRVRPGAAAARERGPFGPLWLWIVPALTVTAAVTNEWHRALWTSVVPTAPGVTTYVHGWWFYVATLYSYLLLASGTVLIARRLSTSPPIFRAQLATIVGAAVFPWLGNVLYLAGWRPGGVDVTPLSFAISGLLFAWALYRNQLFDLVPVARDLVIDSLGDAMVVVDCSHRIVDVNAAARELGRRKGTIGADDRSWIGRPVGTVFPLLQDVPLAATTHVVTSQAVATDGEPATFQVDVLPVRPGGRGLAAWVMLLRDVTAHRRAEAERTALHERVQQQQRRESLSILAGGLAHDFNNLLTGITGHADLLRLQIPASSRMGESVGAILLGSQRAAGLVSKMLAYAGERHGNTELVDLDALTQDLLELLRASAARHCTVRYDGRDALINADPIQIRQVVMNLVINAADVVAEGTGAIDVRISVERLAARDLAAVQFGQDAPPGEYARLDVCDNGCGMDEATLGRIFQPFFTTKPGGHGLGLAAVQGIVLGHRGAMAVESTPGGGSRFRAWFPIAAVQSRQGSRAAASAPPDAERLEPAGVPASV